MNTVTFWGLKDHPAADSLDGTSAAPSQEILGNGTVGIRPFCREDITPLYVAARESIEELCAWMVWCHPDYSIRDCEEFVLTCEAHWERGESFSFAVVDVRNGTFLGSVGLSQVNRVHGVANLGYWVRTSRTGRGIAATAVRLTAGFALQELGFNRLEMVIPTENAASQRVAQKAGARREGILRDKLILKEQPCDAVIYSLVLADYAAA